MRRKSKPSLPLKKSFKYAKINSPLIRALGTRYFLVV